MKHVERFPVGLSVAASAGQPGPKRDRYAVTGAQKPTKAKCGDQPKWKLL